MNWAPAPTPPKVRPWASLAGLLPGCGDSRDGHHAPRRLKLFAHAADGLTNASVEFDPQTLAPTYRLIMGMPGRSNAIAIARRLGMPEAVVAQAQAAYSPEAAEVEDLLINLQQGTRGRRRRTARGGVRPP